MIKTIKLIFVKEKVKVKPIVDFYSKEMELEHYSN
jgi:hypothetical protein